MLQTLGRLTLKNNDLSRPKTLSLLAYLALEGKKSRGHVRELLWGQSKDAATSLRMVLQQLRNAKALLEEQKLLVCAVPCDALLLLEKLDSGDDAGAVDLYTGEFLFGLEFGAAEFEDWVLVTRELIASRVALAHLRLSENALDQSDQIAAVQHALKVFAIAKNAPLEPEPLLRLIRVLDVCGHDLARVVRQEALDLGLEVPLTSVTSRAARSLPTALTSFVARSEQAELEVLLQQRLVTIVGYGGAGKSRLALEVARNLPSQIDVFLVPLEAVLEIVDVPTAILRALNFYENSLEPLAQIKELIAHKKILLLLDNVEHLLGIAQTLQDILLACPALTILLTSRERLGVLGETVFPLEGFKDNQTALEFLRIACLRSSTNLIGQEKIALKICALLERFPLALELAAALSPMLSLEAIKEAIEQHLDALEISQGQERHKGMRAVFNWSWSLLSNQQRQALMRLAVFRDGFSRTAGLQLINSNFVILAALIAKSLVQNQQNGRYRLHPLIAQYSLEAIESKPKEAETAKAIHAEIFLNWLEQHAPLVRTAQAGTVLGAFETDLENIKNAWGWLCQHPDLARFDRLQDMVSLFDARVRFEEGIQLFENAITVLEPRMALEQQANVQNLEQIKALSVLRINTAWLLFRIQSYEKALAHAIKAYEVANHLDNNLQLKILNVLGTIAKDVGKNELALRYLQEAIDLATTINLPLRKAMAQNNVGQVFMAKGKYQEALQVFLEAREIYASLNEERNFLYLNLSIIHLSLFCFENNFIDVENILLETQSKSEEIKDNFILQTSLIYLIFFYSKINQINKSVGCINLFENLLDSVDSSGRAFYKISLAEYYIKILNFEKAELELITASQISYSKKIHQTFQHALFVLGNLYIKNKQLEKASIVLNYLGNQKILDRWVQQKTNDLKEKHKILFDQKVNEIPKLPWLVD